MFRRQRIEHMSWLNQKLTDEANKHLFQQPGQWRNMADGVAPIYTGSPDWVLSKPIIIQLLPIPLLCVSTPKCVKCDSALTEGGFIKNNQEFIQLYACTPCAMNYRLLPNQ